MLGRLLAEDELFRGEVQRAVTTAAKAGRSAAAGPSSLPAAWLEAVAREATDELERWDRLSPEEALSQLGQALETRQAFEAVERGLRKLKTSPASAALWLRLARTWAWFAAEEHGWPALIAWTRHLSGLLKLLKHLEKRDTLLLSLARSDFLAALDLVEGRRAGWSEERDPAQSGAFLCLTWLCAGHRAKARAALPRAEKFADGSAASHHVGAR